MTRVSDLSGARFETQHLSFCAQDAQSRSLTININTIVLALEGNLVNNRLTLTFLTGLDMENLAAEVQEGFVSWPLSSVSNEKSVPSLDNRVEKTTFHATPDFIVLSKSQPGFSPEQIANFQETIEAAVEGAFGQIRYLVLDLVGTSPSVTDPAFLELAGAIETLVRSSAMISVACVRGQVAGAELELALAANLLVADVEAQFSFEAEPTSALGLYGCLAKKLGFVQAERLMDQGKILTTQQMSDLFLVKEILDLSKNLDPLWRFLDRSGRRHNSAHSIYRAQSIASPSIYRSLSLNT